MRISDWSSDVCSSDLFEKGSRAQRLGFCWNAFVELRAKFLETLVEISAHADCFSETGQQWPRRGGGRVYGDIIKKQHVAALPHRGKRRLDFCFCGQIRIRIGGDRCGTGNEAQTIFRI